MTKSLVRKLVIAAMAAALLLGFGYVVARHGPLAPVRVTVEAAAAATLRLSAFGIGTVEAERGYAVGPTAAGRVAAVHVDIGDAVGPGQLLAEMDPVDLGERIAAAALQVGRARHNIDAAAAQLDEAQARYALAEREAQRHVRLAAQGLVSESLADARRQEAEVARTALAARRSALEAARLDLERLLAERAALDKQRANLRLLAPAAAVVTARDAEPGTTLVAGQPVVRLVDPASLRVKARIDQGAAGGLRPGQEAAIVLRSRPHAPLRGVVQRLQLLADSVTEERLVDIAFQTSPPDIALGELAEVTIELAAAEARIALPNAALRRVGTRQGVWRLEGEGIRFAPVTTGAQTLDGLVEVLDGLSAGDRVVVHSERELKADDAISVVDTLAGVAR